MDAIEAIMARKSVRSYLPNPVPKEKLMRVLEAGRAAPSAENRQPWYFVVVTDKEKRKIISKTGRFARFLKDCPVVIVGCGDQKASPKWYAVDTTIAMQNMVIAATAEGLGTCWVGDFDEEKVKELFEIPERFRLIALLAVGFPKKKTDLLRAFVHAVRGKKKLDEITSFEKCLLK